MVDASVALALLLLLAPFIFLIAAAIRIESRGGAFYRCRRVGQHGRELWMLKFRKMHDGARGPALVAPDDERFTRLGVFLARTKLDELPQLWNVLKGEMSLVGPRPEDPGFVELHQKSYESILVVRPGITGLSQLAFARESQVLDPDDRIAHYVRAILPQKIGLDQLYARDHSVRKDLAILMWTAAAVVLRWDVAVHRRSGRLSVRLPREPRLAPAREPALNTAVLEETSPEMERKTSAWKTVARSETRRPPQTTTRSNGHSRNGAGSLKGVQAVIMAGGRGTRLAPYTTVLPKPLMPVGDKSILEIVVEQLEEHGIVDINFCVGYLAHLIQAVFESRENGHVSITYVHESNPLGTAAPLRLVDGLDRTFLVMNGDVLTLLDYGDLIQYHRQAGNAMTIATAERAVKIDYGILHLDGSEQRIRAFEEKPEIVSLVSMGIYVMEPSVIEHIPEQRYFDFPDLVQTLLAAGEPIGAYTHKGLWFDIGRQEDYERAVSVWSENGNTNGHPRNGTSGNGKSGGTSAASDRDGIRHEQGLA